MSDIDDEIKKLKAQISANDKARRKKVANTRISQVQKDAGLFYRFYIQLVLAVIWLWKHVFHPISRFFWWPIKKIFFLYQRVWAFVVYKRDEFGDLKFSKIRAGVFLLTSIPAMMLTTNLVVDGTIFSLTKNVNEEVYLFNASDNSFTEDDEFSVTGCAITEVAPEVGFECDSEDTLYFRVSPGVVEHIWSIATVGHVFYSDSIASAIAPGWNICTTSSWYFRIKFLIKNTNIYPKLLAARCRPLQ